MYWWRIAARNLRRNWRRNVVTTTAIACGFAGLVLVAGYLRRVELYNATTAVYLAHAGHLSIYRKGGLERATFLPQRYAIDAKESARIGEILRRDPNVERFAGYLEGVALVSNGCSSVPVIALGMEPEADHFVRHHPRVVRELPELAKPLRGVELAQAPPLLRGVSLSTGLAHRLSRSVRGGNADANVDTRSKSACDPAGSKREPSDVDVLGTTFDGSLAAFSGSVVGEHTTGQQQLDDSSLIVPLTTLQDFYATDGVTHLAVFLKDPRDLKKRAVELERALQGQGLALNVYPFDDERISLFYVGARDFLLVLSAFVGIVVFFVVVLSIVNTQTMTLLERSRELGALRSIGFTRAGVSRLFLREAALLAAIGLLFGGLLALVVALSVNGLNVRYTPPGIVGDMQLMLKPEFRAWWQYGAALFATVLVATRLVVRSRTKMRIAELNVNVSA